MKVLILGATGLLGSAVYQVMSQKYSLDVFGTIRDESSKYLFLSKYRSKLVHCADLSFEQNLRQLLKKIQPIVVINCLSLSKKLLKGGFPIDFTYTYSLLPHQLAAWCKFSNARLIHISTDAVFSGDRGLYSESNIPDARNLYGLSKLLGEQNESHTVTLRTSMIGHDLRDNSGLLSWFLSQHEICNGYRRVIFSGLPTVILAKIICDYIIPNDKLHGIYHLSAPPISKYDLLVLIAKAYQKKIKIVPVDKPISDLSLNSTKFCAATGFTSPDWQDLIRIMYEFNLING